MKTYKCLLSFEEIIKAKDEQEAMDKFIDILACLGMGWESDNTEIEEVKK